MGCFGVAAAGGQAISTATSGPHGGNMDYRGFKAGATVYLPVFEPGALFFVGDGHAIQGDGEITGTGIEVSFEVQFAVDLRKGGGLACARRTAVSYGGQCTVSTRPSSARARCCVGYRPTTGCRS